MSEDRGEDYAARTGPLDPAGSSLGTGTGAGDAETAAAGGEAMVAAPTIFAGAGGASAAPIVAAPTISAAPIVAAPTTFAPPIVAAPTISAPARLDDESFASRWRRRAVTVPLTLVMTVVASALLPLLVFVLAIDLVRQRRLAWTRAALMLVVFLWCETFGILAAAALWVVYLRWLGVRGPGFVDANARLQALWGHALLTAGRTLLGMRITVEGEVPAPGRGPLVVFARHASTIDTVLPVELLGFGRGWHLRYVLKHELLLDPCLDIVGHRLPNAFVRRGGRQTADEAAKVTALLDGAGARDAIVIFPEGTRFTPRKRAEMIERLRARGPEASDPIDAIKRDLAGSLTHTLSPLRAGPLALLDQTADRNTDSGDSGDSGGADLLVIAHRGLEAAGSLAALGNGRLVGLDVRVRLLHVPAARLPRDAEARARLLADLWREVDAFAAGR